MTYKPFQTNFTAKTTLLIFWENPQKNAENSKYHCFSLSYVCRLNGEYNKIAMEIP